MKKALLFTLGIFLSSCSNNDENLPIIAACDVSNPILELSWLSEEIETRTTNQTEFSKYDFITQGQFNAETVFLYRNCNPIANSIVPVLNCEGTMIGLLSPDIPPEEILEEVLIWKNKDSSCNLTFFGD